MNKVVMIATIGTILFAHSLCTWAVGPKISDMGTPDGLNNNKHNLSSHHKRPSGYKASPTDPRGGEICIFCHTPHNSSSQAQLWNRFDSNASFGHFTSSTLVISRTAAASYNEPTGSSRLCLSCHDGVTAGGVSLGNVVSLTGNPITMLDNNDKIAGLALFNLTKIRTGHHPVSFVYDNNVRTALASKVGETYKAPALPQVKLDKASRMQCTTCHNPHQNQSLDEGVFPTTSRKIAPFWVYGGKGNAVDDHDEVCKDCHNFITPSPWP